MKKPSKKQPISEKKQTNEKHQKSEKKSLFQKKKKMPGRKSPSRDYGKLKREYIEWEGVSFDSFLKEKGIKRTGSLDVRTKGWAKQKKQASLEAAEDALKKWKKEKTKLVQTMHRNALIQMAKAIQQGEYVIDQKTGVIKKRPPTVKEQKIIWDVARTEKGLVTKITSFGEDPKKPFNSLADALNRVKDKARRSTMGDAPEEDQE